MKDEFEKIWSAIRAWPREAWLVVGLGATILWAFWPTLADLADRWTKDAEYSHGYMVPLFSIYLLWARRTFIQGKRLQPSWWGLAILACGLALRFFGTYSFFDWLAAAALVPCLAGLFVLLFGWNGLRWSWPALAFLLFMIPLPYRFEVALAQPLQGVATAASTYALQTLGFSAIAEGNVIRMGDVRIGVVEACSGLSMLLIFFALSTAVVLVVQKPWPEKLIIMLSALPVAIVANVVRITVTGILHKTAGPRLADLVFHDLAGWLMMPLALVILWGILKTLNWVIVPKVRSRAGSEKTPLNVKRLGRSSTPSKSRSR